MLTRNIASEYGESTSSATVSARATSLPWTAPLRERQPDGSRHPFDSFIVAKTPAARWGTPEDLMGPAVFLASGGFGLRKRSHPLRRRRYSRLHPASSRSSRHDQNRKKGCLSRREGQPFPLPGGSKEAKGHRKTSVLKKFNNLRIFRFEVKNRDFNNKNTLKKPSKTTVHNQIVIPEPPENKPRY